MLRKGWVCVQAIAAFVSLAVVSTGNLSNAATDTGTLSVTATVQNSCTLNGGTLSFGEYTTGQVDDLDAEGTISFSNCSGTLTFELDGGQAQNIDGRRMTNGGQQLNYQIYRNAARNSVWGQGGNAQQIVLVVPQSGTVDVYGRIAGGQNVSSGDYTDIVNITLTF